MYGLTMRETSSVCKDQDGFIWTASKTGVLRVSEGDYRIYKLPYKTADIVNVKLVTKNEHLYAFTNNGQLFIYDKIFDRFNLMLDIRELTKSTHLVVNSILIHDNGELWISASTGLYRYNNKRFSRVKLVDSEPIKIDSYTDNSIFVATQRRICILNTVTLKSLPIVRFKESSLRVTKLFYDKTTKLLWVGTISDGLFYYDGFKKTFSRINATTLPKQPILAIENNGNKGILVGIDGQGIWELTNNGATVSNIYREDVDKPGSLPGDGVYDLFCDQNKRIWVATYGGGLSYFDQKSPLVRQVSHKINTSNSLVNNCVNKVLQDKRGNLWFATNNGISCWNKNKDQWTSFYQNKKEQARVFLALAEDPEGNIWAGTYSSGVYVLNGETGREIMHFSQNWQTQNFSAKFIFSILNDSEGDMWLGGIQSDIICMNLKKQSFRRFTSQPLEVMTELSPGKILLGCTYGLLLLDKRRGTTEILLQGYIVHDILVQGNNIWLATSGDGLILYNYKTKSVKKFNAENSGLLSNYLNSIIGDGNYLWIGTENGLSRFDPAAGNALGFSSVFLLSKSSFNLASKYRLDNGNLIFGSGNGAIMFNPDSIYDPTIKGHIYVQDVKISGRSIKENIDLMDNSPLNEKTELKLNYDQNTLEFELIPIGVLSSGFKYSWKMDGLDNDWTSPANRRIITYTNLPAGNFKLRIKMFDSSMSKVIDERILSVHITPPFWASWWFRLILLSLIVGVVYFSLKTYANRLKQRHDEDKLRFFTSTAHDIRTSLTLIKAPIEELNKETNLSDNGRYYLNLATEQSGRLSFVATQLLDFQKVDVGKGQVFLVMVDIVNLVRGRKSMFEASAKKKGVELKFTSNEDSFFSAVDELKIEKVVDNLISNAVKYSHHNNVVDIHLECGPDEWSLQVQDYGLGISDKDQKKLFREFYRGDNVVNSKMVGSGIGLLLVRNYVEMHGGEVELISKENEGSMFIITIPYKQVSATSVAEYEIDNHLFFEGNQDMEQFEETDTENSVEKRVNLLIVEDNNELQNFLRNSFESIYKVTVASDGKQAWEMIRKKMPDLVISDIMMPNMDGFELCKLIKSTFDTAHIPVVLLTALCERSNQLEGLGLGADDYITKPFDMTMLLQRIKSIIFNRAIVREKALKMISQSNEAEPILVNELNDLFVKKALEIVRLNIDNSDFGKDEFASAMNASPSLLYKKIKTLTGLSPVDFIKAIRLNYSLELLQSRKHTVTEVSELCGFSSVGYFSTVFKKHFGKSPTEILGN
jgi:signal transduction histidine kinase/DNA-binding response OmpR family regulator/ligand-binding sensor domain-containing protein